MFNAFGEAATYAEVSQRIFGARPLKKKVFEKVMKTRRKPLSILRRDLKKSSGASLRPSVSKLQRKRTGGALSEATTRSKQKLTNGPLLEGKREHGTPGKEKTSGTALISANADMVSKAKKKSKLTSSDSLSGKYNICLCVLAS